MSDLAQPHPELAALVGSTIHGRYRVDELIATDELGARFEARQLDAKRDVGLRVLGPAPTGPAAAAQTAQLELEARSISRLDHENCVRVTEFGATEGALAYLISDASSGTALVNLLSQAWAPPRALDVAIQIFAALDHAHRQGIIHGGLTSGRVFVAQTSEGRDRVEVGDFGAAKLHAQLVGATATVPVGTQAYGAAEQAVTGPELGADVHAAVLILQQMLAPGAAKLPPSVPSQLTRALTKLLESAGAAHPPSAGAVIVELERLRAGLGGMTPTMVSSTIASDGPLEATGQTKLAELAAGLIIADRFRLEAMVGRGAMGVVWKATHLALQAPVAIKLLFPSQIDPEEARARFLREARASAALRSSHIVQVFDYGVHEGIPYLVMELLEGTPLDVRLASAGALSLDVVIEIMRGVCSAVTRAHEGEVIHRDLKPANIFLVRGAVDLVRGSVDLVRGSVDGVVDGDGREQAKVLDFGIAKFVGAGAEFELAKTQTGAILGTPYYMSPEQLHESKSVDHRADLWSLGVIIYQCLTGRRPFESRSLAELCVSITTADPPAPEELVALPRGMDAWMRKALARDPAQRFASAQALFLALCEVGAGQVSEPRAAAPATTAPVRREREFEFEPDAGPALSLQLPVDAAGRPGSGVPSAASRASPNVKPKRSYWPLLSIGLVLVALASAYLAIRPDPKPDPVQRENQDSDTPAAAVEDPTDAPKAYTPDPAGFGDPCNEAADCGWDDPCAPTRCIGAEHVAALACEGQQAGPPPGECVCVEQHCALRPSEPPPMRATCESAMCGLDQGAGKCVSDSMEAANEHREQGPVCLCDEATRLCEFRWVEPITCKRANDCWATGAPPYYPIPRPRSKRGDEFRPCRDGKFGPACDKGQCSFVSYGCD